MVTFDICDGNPGALTFLMEAYQGENPFKAEVAFQKMESNGITGDKLYMLWNDCCNRNTERTLDMIMDNKIEVIKHFLNYENGRGLRYCPENFPDKRGEEK